MSANKSFTVRPPLASLIKQAIDRFGLDGVIALCSPGRLWVAGNIVVGVVPGTPSNLCTGLGGIVHFHAPAFVVAYVKQKTRHQRPCRAARKLAEHGSCRKTSVDQRASVPAAGLGKPCGGTLGIIREYRSGTVDRDVVDDQRETSRALTGLVDRAAKGDAGMR
jgi:hypothetical protein